MSVTISAWKRCSFLLCFQLFVGGLMSYVCYFCLFAYSDVQHIVCCVFVLFCFSSSCLPVYLNCPFLIATSVFFNIYLIAFWLIEETLVTKEPRPSVNHWQILFQTFIKYSLSWRSARTVIIMYWYLYVHPWLMAITSKVCRLV
jgi:hypothetical protein